MAATKSIELKTSIPGPRSQEILVRKAQVVADPLSIYIPAVIDHGDGATLTDVDGNTFIDFSGGVGCLNVGHAHPRVVEAVQEQAAQFLHTDFTIVPYEAGLGPFAPEVYRVPFPNAYRGPSAADALAALERAFATTVAAETVAAIVIEPVQGEGGFVVSPKEFMDGVRRICDDNGIVLVVDEVQTGYGRTGKMFAIEHYGVEPDVITLAKSIAAGLPLSGVLGKAEIMDAPGDGAIGGTYVGNPVAQAAALAVLDIVEDEDLCAR